MCSLLKIKKMNITILFISLFIVLSAFNNPVEQARMTDPQQLNSILSNINLEFQNQNTSMRTENSIREIGDWEALTYPFNITKFLETEDYLWFPSTCGILRVDKADMSYEIINNIDLGINGNNISAIRQAPNGDIYFGFTTFELDSSTGGVSILHTDETVTIYTMENSEIKSNVVSDFLFDNQGNTWISYLSHLPSRGGISIIDTEGNWEHLNSENSQLPANTVCSMYLDSQSRIWISLHGDFQQEGNYYANGGLAMIDQDGEWHHFDDEIVDYEAPAGSNKSWSVYNVVEDSEGNIWFGLTGDVAVQSGTGFFKFDGETFTDHSIPDFQMGLKSYWHLTIDSQDRIWVNMVWDNFACFDNDEWTLYETGNFIQSINADSEDRIWVGQYGSDLLKVENEEVTVFETQDNDSPIKYNFFNDIASDDEGNMYFGGGWYMPEMAAENALLILNENGWESYSTETFGTCSVNDIKFDGDDLYLATGINSIDMVAVLEIWGGVAIRRNGNWIIHNINTTGFPFAWALHVAKDSYGNLWAGNHLDGLARYNGSWEVSTNSHSNGVTCMLSENDEPVMWFGSAQGLKKVTVNVYGIETVQVFHPGNSNIPDTFINHIAHDNQENLMVSTMNGFARVIGDEIIDYTDLIGNIGVTSASMDELNRIWLATENGIFMIDENENVTHFNSSNTPLPENFVNTICSDQNGKLWANPQGNGLYSYCYDLTSNEDNNIDSPINNSFINIYPNPFNPSTSISFELEQDSKVAIEIFNIRGQKVKTFANNYYQKGKHSVVWNGESNDNKRLSSGVYFCKITTENTSEMKKMLLLK